MLRLAMWLAPLYLCAQAWQPVTPSAWNGARTPDGQPDVGGQWRGSFAGAAGANFDIEEGIHPEEIVVTGRDPARFKRPTIIVDPADGNLPYLPWAREVRDQNRKNSLNPTEVRHLDSFQRCFQMGVPRTFTANFEIMQSPGYVFMIFGNGSIRSIALDGRAHPNSRMKLWMGDSVGRWDGDTLIVNVDNLNDATFYDAYGNFHSDTLKVEERWKFLDKDNIRAQVTSTDPRVFSRPWTMRNEFKRAKYDEVWEDACFEGERNVAGKMVKGSEK